MCLFSFLTDHAHVAASRQWGGTGPIGDMIAPIRTTLIGPALGVDHCVLACRLAGDFA